MVEPVTKENHCQACDEGYPKDDGMHRGNLGTFACPRDRAAHEPPDGWSMTETEQLVEARRRLAWVYHRSRTGLFSFKRSGRDAALADINGWTADFDMYWAPTQSSDPNSIWFGERP